MNAKSLPLIPATLTLDQMREMQQRQIKKHHVAIVLLHWFNALVWFIELSTGLGLISTPAFRIAPEWYTTMMTNAFGAMNLLRLHIAIGMVWIIVFLVYGVFGYRDYLHHEVLIREIGLDRDDFEWLRIRTLLLLKRTREALPPQGNYNAGQKLFALLVYAALPIIALTGLVMAFHVFPPSLVAWAMLLHLVAVGMVVSGLMVHAYMGAVFPEEKPAFFSMITGMVNELYAYRHHYKWWKEIKEEERRWEQELEGPKLDDTSARSEVSPLKPREEGSPADNGL
jgi:formate dehydrogenase subunit gamma